MAVALFRPIRSNLTSVDARNVPKGFASRSNNLRHEDGSARWRLGFRSILGVPGVGIDSQKLFDYVHGRNGTSFYDGYVVVEGPSGSVKPYVVDPTTGTRSLLRTAALSHPALNDSYWRSLVFDAYGYLVNPDDATSPLWRFSVQSFSANNDTLAPIVPPAGPSDAPSVLYYANAGSFLYTRYFGAVASYDLTDVSETGTAVDEAGAAGMVGEQVKLRIAAAGSFTVTCDLKHTGTADTKYNDVYAMTLRVEDVSAAKIDFDNIVASLNASVSQDFTVTIASRKVNSSGVTTAVTLYLELTNKTRTDWTATQSLTFGGTVTDYSSATYLYIGPLVAGGMVRWGVNTNWRLMYRYYDSSTGLVSVSSLAKNLDRNALAGQFLDGDPNFPMGTVPRVTVTAGPADYFKLYAQRSVGNAPFTEWRLVVTQLDSTLTYTYDTLFNDFDSLPEETAGGFVTSGLLVGRVYREWVVWLYRDGTVAHSRIGEPTNLASALDRDDDLSRGQTFNLRGDARDEPRDYHQAGGSGIVLTKNGVYIQRDTDGTPAGMLPPVRQAGAPGCAGFKASCRYRSESGVPGVAYVTQDVSGPSCSVMFLQVDESANADSSYTVHELTRDVRGLIFTHLFESNTTVNSERVNLFVDPRSGALCLLYVDRMMVLRRPNVIDGEREWECYKFNVQTDTWINVAVSADRGIRVRRQGGQLDELFYDSSSNFAEITGATMDGGNAPPADTAYWTSSDLTRPWRRAVRAYLDRTPTTQAFSVQVVTDRQNETSSVAANKENARFGAKTSGRNHKLKVTFPSDTTAVLHGIEYETEVIGQRRSS